ncbi:hypothetical protein [Roseiflexus sp.]|uniref:hypothetical protein n=1 Tax=Roseiflexus sp. TaxID=2562120 RepID=UPI00398B594C
MRFNPRLRRLDPLTALRQSVARLSDEGVYYTRRQLYYEVCQTLLRPSRWYVALSQTAAAVGMSLTVALRRPRLLWDGAVGAVALLSVPPLARRLPFTMTPPLADAAFEEALATYRAQYGEPIGLLADVLPSSLPIFDNYREPDLYDYGLPYVIVCQDAAIAHMLRANDLHMVMGCAIVALEEATPLPDVLVTMLMRAAAPYVLLLHDASGEGLTFAANARKLLDLPSGVQVRALGLRPRHALRLHLFAARGAGLPPEVAPNLGVIERLWLRAGYATEVAALRPTSLLRALQRSVDTEWHRSSWFTDLRRWRSTGYMSWPE